MNGEEELNFLTADNSKVTNQELLITKRLSNRLALHLYYGQYPQNYKFSSNKSFRDLRRNKFKVNQDDSNRVTFGWSEAECLSNLRIADQSYEDKKLWTDVCDEFIEFINNSDEYKKCKEYSKKIRDLNSQEMNNKSLKNNPSPQEQKTKISQIFEGNLLLMRDNLAMAACEMYSEQNYLSKKKIVSWLLNSY